MGVIDTVACGSQPGGVSEMGQVCATVESIQAG